MNVDISSKKNKNKWKKRNIIKKREKWEKWEKEKNLSSEWNIFQSNQVEEHSSVFLPGDRFVNSWIAFVQNNEKKLWKKRRETRKIVGQ